jgi:hypothetical protein
VVVKDSPESIRLCSYGSDKSSSWNGDICDTVDKAKSCPYFQPRVTLDQSIEEFQNLIHSDNYVSDNFKDVAALQWVLEDRLSNIPLSFFEKITLFIFTFFKKPEPPVKQLTTPDPTVPEEIWDDNVENSGP